MCYSILILHSVLKLKLAEDKLRNSLCCSTFLLFVSLLWTNLKKVSSNSNRNWTECKMKKNGGSFWQHFTERFLSDVLFMCSSVRGSDLCSSSMKLPEHEGLYSLVYFFNINITHKTTTCTNMTRHHKRKKTAKLMKKISFCWRETGD